MSSSFLITLREGLEAGLIVAIILAYLKSSHQRRHFRTVFVAALAAVAISLAVGAAIFAVAGEFEGRSAEAFEGLTMLLAVGVLSWMIVWMKQQSAGIKRNLEHDVAQAIGMGSVLALALIPFTAILREGLETAVFLFAATRTSTPLESTIGASAGILAATGLTWGIYSGGYRINLRTFFNVTGVLLIFFAAGLLAHGIHELQEAALLPFVVEHVWDINHILDDGSGVGLWLKALFGYNGNPSLVEVIAYPAFLALALSYFVALRPNVTVAPSKAAATPDQTRLPQDEPGPTVSR
ncbi:MAG TPA: iron uptake transporter permease EfeU [Dehalococcoidia bacterium]|nr:iron uptake transporter permease EfeU [Dehalococcoidia bacterium]